LPSFKKIFIPVLPLLIVGCGGSDSTVTVRERVVVDTPPGVSDNSGPQLGDDCTAETTISTEVEVSTIRGPLQCREAQRVMEIYFANAATAATGSGAGLEIGDWSCLSAPPPQHPLAGRCQTGDAQREFEMYSIGYAFRPENQDVDCHLPPPDGAGQSNLRATDIDCDGAERVLDTWSSKCASSYRTGACPVGDGVSCTIVELGYELSQIKCKGRRGQLVTFETGA
jgi:hypothetical protein